MTEVSPAMQDLARRILSLEAARAGDASIDDAVQVCEKLRNTFSRLSGLPAYLSLLQRALVLAKQADPRLRVVAVQPDGSLAGLSQIDGDHKLHESQGCRVVLVANLLGLLSILIGEPLMRRFASDIWPELSAKHQLQREELK